MNRLLRAIIAVLLVAVITFSAISICQSIGGGWRLDITEKSIYTLSDGTKAILAGLNQPIKMKLYYAKTAALKGTDQIRYFNNYYNFVKALLEEYVSAANGMIDLQVIDPRPFSDDEVAAIRYGLRRFSITQEESFFFGLVVQTEFGVEKSIAFFAPDRQAFLEYDISYLLDTAITHQRKRIGIMSSLPVMGENISGYMAQMMRIQNIKPKYAWSVVRHLQQMYEVSEVATDVDQIKDVDILLVIHPKDLPEKTLFAIDQFVMKGGRTIMCLDPHCVVDQAEASIQPNLMQIPDTSSELNKLLNTWGLDMPIYTFAGDLELAISGGTGPSRSEKIIGYLDLTDNCFNPDNVISADLNRVRMVFAGILKKTASEDADSAVKFTPLLMTTAKGNSWTISNAFELVILNARALLDKFTEGTEPVVMAYLITGPLKSSFPEGIEVNDESSEADDKSESTRRLTGLTESAGDCAVVVISDVDFISDILAYQQTFFGITINGDNSTFLINAIEDLTGSTDLISIRSRGNFSRPFTVVDEIEKEAEKKTAEEETKINMEIAGIQRDLNEIVSSAKGSQKGLIGDSIMAAKQELDLKIHQARIELRKVKMKKRESIERLGRRLRNFCTLPGPAVILLIAIVLGIRRSTMRRHYISHGSDS